MKKQYIELGSSPAMEACVQVGSDNYAERAIDECKRFIARIREVLGNEPEGAELKVKRFHHDFGSYYEVVCYYEDDNEVATDYAFLCESESPVTWK